MPDHQAPPTVVARNLEKRFGDFTAVAGVDFEVSRGEIFGFLGPNGSGKTTTIRMLLGLLKPTAGSMQVLGISVREHPEQILPRVGYMAQQFSLYRDLTALQNLQFHGTAYGLKGDEVTERARQALDQAGLADQAQVKTRDLAGGWRQRLALGAAMLHQPEVLFLDEPTAGVDPLSRRAFWELLYELAENGVTIFVTTHYMDEAEHCHRLAFLQRGSIIASGSPAELKSTLMSGEVLEITPSDPTLAIRTLRRAQVEGRLDIEKADMYGSLVHVTAPQMRKTQRLILRELRRAGVRVSTRAIVEPSLEDIFVASMR